MPLNNDNRYSIDDFHLATESVTRTLPRGIVLRRGREADEQATFEVMRRAMGFDLAFDNHSALRNHLRESPDCSFWLAEDTPRFARHRTVGYARSVVRDSVWSLTEFFVNPDFQGRGVGTALLEQCLEEGVRAGADTRLVLASMNGGADSLYIRKLGCLPRLPMILLAGSPLTLKLPPERENTILEAGQIRGLLEPHNLYAEPIVLNPETESILNALDREGIGFARPTEHRFRQTLIAQGQCVGRLFRKGSDTGEIVGYAYAGAQHQGPIYAKNPNDLPRIFLHITQQLRQRLRGAPIASFSPTLDYYASLAGTNETLLPWLAECDWRIIFHYLYMSSRPMGQLDRYVGHNPLYVL